MEILTQDILTEYIRIICNTATSINYKKKQMFYFVPYIAWKILQVFQNTRNGRIIGNFNKFTIAFLWKFDTDIPSSWGVGTKMIKENEL